MNREVPLGFSAPSGHRAYLRDSFGSWPALRPQHSRAASLPHQLTSGNPGPSSARPRGSSGVSGNVFGFRRQAVDRDGRRWRVAQFLTWKSAARFGTFTYVRVCAWDLRQSERHSKDFARRAVDARSPARVITRSRLTTCNYRNPWCGCPRAASRCTITTCNE